jgi:hypothetical protein
MRAAQSPTTPRAPLSVATGEGVYTITETKWPNGSTGWDIRATTRDAAQAAIDGIASLIDERGGHADFQGPLIGFGGDWIAAGHGHINQ